MPILVADAVAGTTFTGQDLSEKNRDGGYIAKIEARRQVMTTEELKEFCEAVDDRYLTAYLNGAEWFMDIVQSENNEGRNQLYVFVSHWLSSYLSHPEVMRRRG